MKKLFSGIAAGLLLAHAAWAQPATAPARLATLLQDYYETSAKLDPVSATFRGDARYNDQLPIDFTDSYRAANRRTWQDFLSQLRAIDRSQLTAADALNYDVLRNELLMHIERLSLPDNVLVFSQFSGLPQSLALLGSGASAQPFKTVADYDNWLKRASVFPAWSDSAIVYFRKGMRTGMVLPKVLVEKLIPQLHALVASDITKSTFYKPIAQLPASFSDADQQRLTKAFRELIQQQINPSYQKLSQFMQTEYLPKARTTAGYGALPGGKKLYDFRVRQYTTTNLSAEAIHNIGLQEVARIRKEMEAVKKEVGFTGSLKEFFAYMRNDPKFFPYKNAEGILNYYRAITPRIQPQLSQMFNRVPQTPFEVREVEAFRAATAAAHYFAGSLEQGRPGIFYVPILDASKTQSRESLFLHEAIPGHHYQISLQYENKALPGFRRYGFSTAYMEGWGLYAESLGKELGVYTDPYQYMLALGDEMHRAIRLVVDAGIHAKGWTREQAIQYSLDNEPIEEQRAISEIERYMAYAGQALSYKIGELKLKQLRARYEKHLGKRFNLAAFHDAILMDGALPLDLLERKMDAWAKTQ